MSPSLDKLCVKQRWRKFLEKFANGAAINEISEFVQWGFVAIDNSQECAAAFGDNRERRGGLNL